MKTVKMFFAGLLLISSASFALAQTADDYGTGTSAVTSTYCPGLSITMQRGSTDATTGGQVSKLQRFLIERGYLDIESPTGRLAGLTVQAVKDFQSENGLPSLGIVGSLTRATIARMCGSGITTTTTTTTNTTSTASSVIINQARYERYCCKYADAIYIRGSNLNQIKTLVIYKDGIEVGRTSFVFDTISYPGEYGFGIDTLVSSLVDRATYSVRVIDTNNRLVEPVLSFMYVKASDSTTTSTTNTNTGSLPTVTTNVSSASIQTGAYTLFSWDSTGATSCTLYSGTQAENASTSGYKYVYPTQTTTYRVACSNSRGTAEASKTVTVTSTTQTQANAPTVTMNVSSSTIVIGGYVLVSWDSANATSCFGRNLTTNSVETVGTSGYRYLYPTFTTSYRVECSNAQGVSSVAEKTVAVNALSTNNTTTAGTTNNTNATPSVSVVSSTPTLVTGSYVNLPGGTQILLVNRGTGAQLTTPSAYISNSSSGSFTITLPSTLAVGSYALRAYYNYQILAESPVTFAVTAPTVTAPTIGLSASNYNIQAGNSTTIAWNTVNASSCTATANNSAPQQVNLQDSVPVVLRETTTYKLTCTSGTATAEKSITINVTGAYGALIPVTNITQTKTSTAAGESFDISWTSQNAVSCTVETNYNGAAWSYASEGTSGTRTVVPTTIGTYQARVTCLGGVGTSPTSSTISHTVTAGQTTATNPNSGVPTVGLSAYPTTITYGNKSKIAWNTANATACTVYFGNGNVEQMPVQGEVEVAPQVTTTFRLVCSNSTNSAEKSITVTVNPVTTSTVSSPTSAQINLNPTSVAANSNFTVSWSGNNSPASYNVKIDSTILNVGGATTWTGTPASLGLGAGNHAFSVQACDSTGTPGGCSVWSGTMYLVVTGGTSMLPPSAMERVLGSKTMCVILNTPLLSLEDKDVTTNGEVTELQNFLISKGMLFSSSTGYYGKWTAEAVKDYQRSKGIEQTGNVGVATKAAIKADSCGN